MNNLFSDRIADVPRSFIREILKTALQPNVISFAGGLPNRDLFPVEEIKAATVKVIDKEGRDVFQYGNSEGSVKLREYIAGRYRTRLGLDVAVDEILITNGSQQGLDLLGKVILNEGEGLVIEEPGYLGAIQAFSLYRPAFLPVPVSDAGMDTVRLSQALQQKPKLMYTVPNFQNPSGITYSDENRRAVAELLAKSGTVLIEDDPYGELRFSGEAKRSFKQYLPKQTVMLGSFSKTVVPGFRLGWIVAPKPLMDKLVIAKQAADLHTSHLPQAIIRQYLEDNDIDRHIAVIRDAYGRQCRAMLSAMERQFPAEVRHTHPEGGMFVWAELPEGLASLDLFELAVKENVVFVPGDPFYVNRTRTRTMRINFSCVDEATIGIGIERLGNAMRRMMKA
ncbi:MAG: PLP-dependent aminotransferase family protein [Nitrospiraceae bacterium]|nr:PLP-dependent aminotransferase family protein [Nitrospiraceae bacterium]